MTINRKMITTAFDIPNYSIVESLGIVRGISVRSPSLVGGMRAGIQTLFGGNINVYTKLCEKTRAEALEILIDHAQELGANAIIGLRYDANELAAGVTEVLAYGTAVIVEPIKNK